MLQKLPSEVIFFSSPVGDLRIEIGENGVKGLKFVSCKLGKGAASSAPTRHAQKLQTWLKDYFAGLNPAPFPWEWIDLSAGTLFQQKIWHSLWKIPPGQVISYKELAARAKSPKAHRAAGNANGKNPLPILIPCHRVITANGKIGGYSCGVPIKKKLLAHEGINL